MRFLGLGLGDKVADAKTIWLFCEHLIQARAIDNLFARFDKYPATAGYLAIGGQIIDADTRPIYLDQLTWSEEPDTTQNGSTRVRKAAPQRVVRRIRFFDCHTPNAVTPAFVSAGNSSPLSRNSP